MCASTSLRLKAMTLTARFLNSCCSLPTSPATNIAEHTNQTSTAGMEGRDKNALPTQLSGADWRVISRVAEEDLRANICLSPSPRCWC